MNKLASVLLLALIAGCVSDMTHYEARFGDAVREAKNKMIIDPDAGKNPDQVTGIDGKAARETMLRYQDSFKVPPPVVNVINIGGGFGSSQ